MRSAPSIKNTQRKWHLEQPEVQPGCENAESESQGADLSIRARQAQGNKQSKDAAGERRCGAQLQAEEEGHGGIRRGTEGTHDW
ncbi:small integral membrane protein 7 isoform X1 [Empidonax traillii]|uniref:small integral membrane protein 7 isoform X1 n=1 Tax=Empidonax traillii TaxID=164674 RepID=UPI000FFD70C1|nr:small integral membrane protein 7 isoform X1 [Empidonax traillii]